MLFRIYVDEVGNHDLASADNINERFLSLTGIIISSDAIASTVAPDLDAIKRNIFHGDPDEPVILHRKDILKQRGPFKIFSDPAKRAAFNQAILAGLDKWDFKVITVTIDKLAHREQYQVWKAHPYHYCLEVLLERFVMFLQERGGRGDIMVESRGGKEDLKLKASYKRLFEGGTDYINVASIQARLTSKELKVKPKSANVPGLQLADLIAYPSRADILHERGFLPPVPPSFSEAVIAILLRSKYLRNSRTGEIWGFGKKLLPK